MAAAVASLYVLLENSSRNWAAQLKAKSMNASASKIRAELGLGFDGIPLRN